MVAWYKLQMQRESRDVVEDLAAKVHDFTDRRLRCFPSEDDSLVVQAVQLAAVLQVCCSWHDVSYDVLVTIAVDWTAGRKRHWLHGATDRARDAPANLMPGCNSLSKRLTGPPHPTVSPAHTGTMHRSLFSVPFTQL